MVNEKPKKVEKKSTGKAVGSSKKTTSKKKSPATEIKLPKEIKPVAKKVTKKTVVKIKPKASSVKKATTAKVKKPVVKKKLVSKKPKKVATVVTADLKIEKASKTQREKIENVIDKLSQTPEQKYITTVPGVLRKVPAVQKTVPTVHEVPITGILNYLKKMF